MTPKSTLANVNAWVRLIIHLFIHARIHVLTHAPISLSLSHTKQTNKTNQNNTELDPLHQGLIVQRATLKARDYQIDLAANLNKTTVHSITGPLSQQAGFYCDVCDVMLKDSMAYLNHINGKWHNRALGMSMNVEKSTVDQVKKRLEEVKQRKKQGGARGSGGGTRGEGAGRRLEQGEEDGDEDGDDDTHVPDGMNKEELKKQGEGVGGSDDYSDDDDEDKEEEDIDPDLAAMMGFGGFGGSKKNT